MSLSPSIEAKLEGLAERQEELSALLSDAEVVNDRDRYTSFSKEFSELAPVIESFSAYQKLNADLDEARELAEDDDEEMRALARDDIAEIDARMEGLSSELLVLLLPRDPNDERNIFLEIRAGAGGDEAAIFAGDLFRMYARFAESRKWRVGILNERPGEHGGYREIIARIEGPSVYSQLKFESGIHRVQRVPETESKGRLHTSACSVAVLPEADEIEDVEIDKSEIRVDTFRASGAGGQHVNKTDSAVRLTHLPTGIVVECQDERSQLKNRSRAMQLLQAKLLDAAQEQQRSEQAEQRKSLVGSGDRSEKIRTYNFPQARITDHRISLTLYSLGEVLGGDLDQVVVPLKQEAQAAALKELGSGDY